MKKLWSGLMGVLLAIGVCTAHAQAWPSKPVKIVVPFPTGGSADPIARIIAAQLQASLGQTFFVENRPGASGVIGTEYVANAAPDGYTFVVVFDTHAENPALLGNLPYDTMKALAPVTLIGTSPMIIATGTGKPFQTFADFVQTARARPGTVTVGSASNGSLGHLSIMVIQDLLGTKVVHVPYKGAQALVTDTVGGHVDAGIGSIASMAAQIQGGKLRALALTGNRRSPMLPTVPTLAEQGVQNFESYAWWAMLAPAGTPAAIVERLHAETVRALESPQVRAQLADQLGVQISGNKPEELRTFIASEMQRWGKVIRDNNIRAD